MFTMYFNACRGFKRKIIYYSILMSTLLQNSVHNFLAFNYIFAILINNLRGATKCSSINLL